MTTSHDYHQQHASSRDLKAENYSAAHHASSGMPINFDFTATVTLFNWTSRNGFEYFVLLAFAFSLAYLQEYLTWIRSKENNAAANSSSSSLENAAGTRSSAGSKGYESLRNGGGGVGDVKENFPANGRVLQSSKYCAHAAVSYSLMLCVMSLNFGVFASVLLGLGVGKYIFIGGSGVGGRRSLMSDACHPGA
jgi:hypothetical protein